MGQIRDDHERTAVTTHVQSAIGDCARERLKEPRSTGDCNISAQVIFVFHIEVSNPAETHKTAKTCQNYGCTVPVWILCRRANRGHVLACLFDRAGPLPRLRCRIYGFDVQFLRRQPMSHRSAHACKWKCMWYPAFPLDCAPGPRWLLSSHKKSRLTRMRPRPRASFRHSQKTRSKANTNSKPQL